MLFTDITTDYETYLLHEQGLTPTSRKTYHHWLAAFNKWADNEKVGQGMEIRFTLPVLRKYQYYLSKAGKRPRTIHNALGPLRSIGDWVVTQGLMEENPTRKLTLPKLDAAHRPLASDDDLARLLAAADKQGDVMKAARDTAIIHVLVFCGVRYQELLDIKVQHIDLSGKTLLIASGKGRKPRLLWPNEQCMLALAEWLRERELVKPRYDWLWVCDARRRMGVNGVRAMLDDTKARADLSPHAVIAPHAIRRAYATRCLKNNMDLRSLSASLGHSQVSTTLIYTFDSERPAQAMRDHADLRLDKPRNDSHANREASTIQQPLMPAKPNRANDIRSRRTRQASK